MNIRRLWPPYLAGRALVVIGLTVALALLAPTAVRAAGHIRPHVACATHVWEITEDPPKPFLNRYDYFGDDGNGNCILIGTSIESATIDGDLLLPVPNSLSTLVEANVTINGRLDVAPSSLAMAPGTQIDVAAGGALDMSDGAITSASGTPQQGDWGGISFWSGSTGNLDNVTMAGAGWGVLENATGLCCAGAAIYIAADANPTITNSTVDRSAGHGFEIDGRGPGLPTFGGDSVTNSGQNSYYYAVYYDNTPNVMGMNDFAASNDIHNSVRIPGGTITSTLTLVNPGLPVQVDNVLTIANGGTLGVAQGARMLFNIGGVTISSGGTMSVAAGALLQFMNGERQNALYVAGGGTLTMIGTAASPVVLTSGNATPHPGDWAGIAFWPGAAGSLSHVQVSYAGSGLAHDANLSDCCANAGIYINQGANPSITNTSVDHSSGNGFELDGQDLTTFSGDGAANNGGFAVYYDHTPARTGANLFSASGNVHDGVRIPGGTLSGMLSLSYPGLPTQLDGMLTITGGASLSIDHDQQLLLMPGGGPGGDEGITVWHGGSLTASAGTHLAFAAGNAAALYVGGSVGMAGTRADPIVLSSAAASPQPGDWGGIAFWSGGGGNLNDVQVSYPGASMHSIAPPNLATNNFVHAGVYVGSGAGPNIVNTTVDHSYGEGFELDGRDFGTYSGDGAAKGADFTVYYDNVPNRIGANLFTGGGNTHDAVRLPPGTVSGALSFVYPGLPVQIDGALTITRGASLTIDPYQSLLFTSGGGPEGVTVLGGGLMSVSDGTRLQFALGELGAMYVDNGGTLDMTGTATDPISLTSPGATPGSWSGLAFWPGSTGHLSYVYESFAGYGLYTDPSRSATVNAGLYVNNGATPSIVNTTVDHSFLHGFEIDGRGAASFGGDTATNNGSSDGGFAVYYDHTPSVVGVNLFTASGNGHDAVRIPPGTVSGALSVLSPGIPVQVDGMLTITRGASLSIGHDQQVLFATQNFGGVTVSGGATMSAGAGARLRFEAGRAGALYVDSGGTLSLSGTATDPISLTSTNATPSAGDWGGVAFWPGSHGSLSYAHLSGAGFSLNTRPGQCCAYASLYVNGAAPAIQNATIDRGQGNDVEVANGGLPVLHDDGFGALQNSSYLGVKNDNGTAGPLVDARYDWWGSASGPSGVGPGTGVPVGAGVTFSSWLGATPGTPGLTRSRVSGVWKDTVTITGANFGADEPISVYWDSTATAPLSNTTCGPDGTFTDTFSVPQAISGTHTIIAMGQTSGLSATTPFLIRPATFLLHYQGNKGTVNVLKGAGFGPHETVVGYWNSISGTPFPVTATTNSIGTFGGSTSFPSITFTVPLSPAGSYKVFGVGQTSGGVAFSTFTLKPHLQITPSSGPAGSQVTVATTGYGANETVTLKYNCGTANCTSTTVLATPTTDATGFFSVLVTLPSPSSVGVHALGGTGTTSGVFATATFTATP